MSLNVSDTLSMSASATLLGSQVTIIATTVIVNTSASINSDALAPTGGKGAGVCSGTVSGGASHGGMHTKPNEC